MKLKNDFPPEVKNFWISYHPFSYSGLNQDVEIHHIKGRCSNSIFNSIPLTHKEHEAGDIHRPENEAFFIEWVYKFVRRICFLYPTAYKLRKADYEFMNKYEKKYVT